MLTNFKSVSMNCDSKNLSKKRVSTLLDSELDQLLERDIAKRYQNPDARVTKSSLINEIIRLHYKGEFHV
jgi:hypothetical protein